MVKSKQTGRVNEFLRQIETSLGRRQLCPRGSKLLVAVSGGVDSLVLLHGLHQLAAEYHWKLAVAHFNHQLRGRASAADEKLVCATAKKLSLPVFCGCGDVKRFSRQHKISTEMAARRLRHEFLARVARQEKISTIALAHHADDQVELFFLRLLRGAGGEGLAGMKWCSPSPADPQVKLIRPLLNFSKAELLDYARENKIKFREDATNFSTDFLRNRIRTELLPLLRKKYQPAVDRTILRLMDIAGAEAEFVAAVAARIRNQKLPAGKRFAGLPLAIQRRILKQQLIGAGLLPDFDLIEQLRLAPDQSISVGSGITAARDAIGKVSLGKPTASEFRSAEQSVNLSGRAGRVTFAGRKFAWQLRSFNGSRGRSLLRTEFFDADKVGGKITLRHWRPGDRFHPIGMKSAVKLQDLFVNAKIPAAQRRALVLAMAASGAIFWVEGLRIGENFKLTNQTRRKLIWKWPKSAVLSL